MKNIAVYFSLMCASMLVCTLLHAQDSTKPHLLHNIFQKIMNSITVAKVDSSIKATVLNNKSEQPYEEHEGKVIRRIIIKELGFEKVFTDTTKTINYYGTRILNALHTDTWAWVIRDNLFIKAGTRINRFVVADNERYLRSLDFIQDARIIAIPIRGTNDSIDLEVITKDLFSITGSLDIGSTRRQKINIAENNLAGAGQKIQFTTLVDQDRQPSFGYDLRYTKNSVLHSFINASVGYSKINRDRFGDEGISTFYVQLNRPLVSPFSRIAGGFHLDVNNSSNAYIKPDSLYFDFRNTSLDVWAGYNIGVNKLLENNDRRSRTFAAVRYFQNRFGTKPFQIKDQFDAFYNDRQGVLGEVTFYKQEFYQTNYIYGFGTTEDVPYGYNIALTSGWYKQLNLQRFYGGFNAGQYSVTRKGEFFHGFLRAGGFLSRGELEDASILLGGSFYSKLFLFKKHKMRQYVKVSFSRLVDMVTNEPLRINNALGLRYFGADSLSGRQRMSAYAETFLFLKTKLLGFQLAPFAFIDASLLTGENTPFYKSDMFTGIGGGLRTRNENLIFGTMELRLAYFPRRVPNMNPINISFTTNLRFRYNSNYVKSPDFIRLNSDDTNSFY